ncbi:ferredoxin reductase [Sphingomonas sp. CARO-RG-8B-R24-01]|uniref:ferredoxin reductase n=1 Tax=Sphingomonas sp. CARO-RG-8B-R24-01 TaxID=2914831 RepID=UPI001F57AB5E|nr:ferredoxin reductase [Sphingomonas sp. CARO-RG-8B-R24-01]
MANEQARWRVATLAEKRRETPNVWSFSFAVPDWPGHLAGQHVDLRLTSEDGYQAQRSYSIASAAGRPERLELTIEEVAGGEVSPFLVNDFSLGDGLELRGPIGGYFTWEPNSDRPLMLIGGGSGVVPLVSMLRTRAAAGARNPATLLYSVRTIEDLIYRSELEQSVEGYSHVPTITREAPPGWTGERHRIDRAMLERHVPPPSAIPIIFVCGPTRFVETAAELLVGMGHPEALIKTERFGPTGES